MSASKAGQNIIPIIMSDLVIAGALWIANTGKTWGFQHVQKQTLPL
ncbi:MAG: hypothetical protein ACM3PY_03050 [Omnitrophica WOR_2 bacterium]